MGVDLERQVSKESRASSKYSLMSACSGVGREYVCILYVSSLILEVVCISPI
jgi:hypothetical protein